ncbi:MAG: ATP-grasp domain-containing protein [Eubacteriales bacterium]|nr:ATP-grasp domain-containing protein [Eubacteriales bacterium]
MKKLLILGGTKNQVPLIQAAKNEGYYVIVCDWTTTNPGIALADKHYQVSTLDYDAVIDVARKEKIDGIISNSEPAMMNVARVAEELKLIGNSVHSIEQLSSKDLFRKLQKESCEFAPKHFSTKDIKEFLYRANAFDYPVIVKPAENSGTRGTKKIDRYDEKTLIASFEECVSLSRNGKCAIEEYVEMPKHTVIEGEVFVNNHCFFWEGFFSTERSELAPMIPMTYSMPLRLPPQKMDKIKSTLSKLFLNAGIRHGEYNVELYFTKSGDVFVIEINVRQGGNYLPDLVAKHCGVDMYRLLITTVVGDNKYWNEVMSNRNPFKKYVTRHAVFSHQTGKYMGVSIEDTIKRYITSISEQKAIGDRVDICRNGSDLISLIDFEFPDVEMQHYYKDRMESMVIPIVVEDRTR